MRCLRFREWIKSLKPKNSVPVLAVSLLLRAIALHSQNSTLNQLRQRETRICEWILREKVTI